MQLPMLPKPPAVVCYTVERIANVQSYLTRSGEKGSPLFTILAQLRMTPYMIAKMDSKYYEKVPKEPTHRPFRMSTLTTPPRLR